MPVDGLHSWCDKSDGGIVRGGAPPRPPFQRGRTPAAYTEGHSRPAPAPTHECALLLWFFTVLVNFFLFLLLLPRVRAWRRWLTAPSMEPPNSNSTRLNYLSTLEGRFLNGRLKFSFSNQNSRIRTAFVWPIDKFDSLK